MSRRIPRYFAVLLVTAGLFATGFSIGLGVSFSNHQNDQPTAQTSTRDLRFNLMATYPLVPVEDQQEYSLRAVGKFYWIKQVTPDLTTLVFDDVATAPCDIVVPTKQVELHSTPELPSGVKFSFKPDTNLSKLFNCSDLRGKIDTIHITAEPEIFKMFKPTG